MSSETQGRRRIAFVVPRLGVGGAERQLISLVNSMDRGRFVPSVVCLKDIGPMGVDLREGTDVVALGSVNGNDPRVVASLCGVLRERAIELVHCTNFNATFWGRTAARRCGLPMVTAEHSTNRTSNRERLLVRLGNLLYDRHTSAVVACAHAQVESLVREGCSKATIRVIHNGVDPGGFVDQSHRSSVRAEFGVSENEVLVLVVASLAPQKNHASLVRAAAQCIDDHVPLRLVFAGEGATRGELESLATELGIRNQVALPGVRQDIPDLLAASDLVALSSLPLVETFPMCLLEAMAGGRAVLSTAVGGVPEMVADGATGIVVSPGDDAALAAALARLARDGNLRSMMGSTGRERVKADFTLRKMTSEYEALFEEVLAGEVA